MDKTIYKTRLRTKGQITVPQEIRNLLVAEEGDDLLFYTDEAGRVVEYSNITEALAALDEVKAGVDAED